MSAKSEEFVRDGVRGERERGKKSDEDEEAPTGAEAGGTEEDPV
jgi:hypothetical protein